MTEDLENQLRSRLRPVQPPEGFAERVMRALPAKPAPSAVAILPRKAAPPQQRSWMPAALAASLLVAVFLGQRVSVNRTLEVQRLEEQQGFAASRELMQALRVTSQKLDIAYQAVQSPPQAPAEENHS